MTPRAVLVDLNDLSAWRQARRQGIGSSDAAALLGMDKYASPMSVWLSKVDPMPDEDNAPMKWGRRLESAVADEFGEENPEYLVERAPCMYAAEDAPWMLCNPDRLLHPALIADPPLTDFEFYDDPDALLEIKTSTSREDEFENGPPDRTLIQVQHQLAVMGFDYAWIACLRNGREYRQWRVERDDKAIDLLRQVEQDFWNDHVRRHVPPPVDNSNATAEALRHLYRDSVEEEKPLDDLADLFASYPSVKDEYQRAASAKVGLESKIRAALGRATVGTIDGETAVTYRQARVFDEAAFTLQHPDLAAQYASGVDLDALKRDHLALYETYRKPGSRRLNIK